MPTRQEVEVAVLATHGTLRKEVLVRVDGLLLQDLSDVYEQLS
jgi:hypothetical protein